MNENLQEKQIEILKLSKIILTFSTFRFKMQMKSL